MDLDGTRTNCLSFRTHRNAAILSFYAVKRDSKGACTALRPTPPRTAVHWGAAADISRRVPGVSGEAWSLAAVFWSRSAYSPVKMLKFISWLRACAQAFADHLRQRPELLPNLLTTLFELVLFEECTNQWSLSRPMLSLILLNEQACCLLWCSVMHGRVLHSRGSCLLQCNTALCQGRCDGKEKHYSPHMQDCAGE